MKPTIQSLYLLSLLLIITVVPSLGLSHTKAASLCSASQRNYRLSHRKREHAKVRPCVQFHFWFQSTFLSPLTLIHSSLPAHPRRSRWFQSRANLYFQDNQRLDTHSFPILQSGRLNGNWRFNFWNETQESFWNWLSPSALPSPPAWVPVLPSPLPPHHHLLSPSWSAEYSQFLCLYGDVGEMATAKRSLKALQLPPTSLRHLFSMPALSHH